jgi:hypothetical protein
MVETTGHVLAFFENLKLKICELLRLFAIARVVAEKFSHFEA